MTTHEDEHRFREIYAEELAKETGLTLAEARFRASPNCIIAEKEAALAAMSRVAAGHEPECRDLRNALAALDREGAGE